MARAMDISFGLAGPYSRASDATYSGGLSSQALQEPCF